MEATPRVAYSPALRDLSSLPALSNMLMRAAMPQLDNDEPTRRRSHGAVATKRIAEPISGSIVAPKSPAARAKAMAQQSRPRRGPLEMRRANNTSRDTLPVVAVAAIAVVLAALLPTTCYAGSLPTMLVESGKPKCVAVSVPMDTKLRVDYEAPGTYGRTDQGLSVQ